MDLPEGNEFVYLTKLHRAVIDAFNAGDGGEAAKALLISRMRNVHAALAAYTPAVKTDEDAENLSLMKDAALENDTFSPDASEAD